MYDFNHDGKVDMKDHYDDLGGAYYFRPTGKDAVTNDEVGWCGVIFGIFICIIIIGIGLLIAEVF